MKLKYIDVNGFGILVDENTVGKNIGEGVYYDIWKNAYPKISKYYESDEVQPTDYKILFAEKELNLNVPVLPNYKEWKLEQLSDSSNGYSLYGKPLGETYLAFKEGFKACYSKNKYTEEDILDAWELGAKEGLPLTRIKKETLINSLKKIPKYIVVEGEQNIVYENIFDGNSVNKKWVNKGYIPKLIINSEGKKECVIEEIIY